MGWAIDVAPEVVNNTFPSVALHLSHHMRTRPSQSMPAAFAYSASTPIHVSSAANIGAEGTASDEVYRPRTRASVGSRPSTHVGVGTLLFNSTSTLALPAMVDSMYDALVQQASGGEVSVVGSMQSLPRAAFNQNRFNAFVDLFASLVITIPFAFVAAQFVTPLVRERESGSKQMQFTSGVGQVAYWLANWAWDLALHVFVTGCSLVIFKLEGRHEFMGTPEALGGTTLLLLCFGLAVVPLASAASFFFETPSSGLIVMIAFHFLTGFGFNVLDYVLSIFYWKGNIRAINRSLRGLYRLFPAYCLGQGFFEMSTRSLQSIQRAITGDSGANGLYEWSVLGAPLTYLLGEAVLFVGLTLLLQLLALVHLLLCSQLSLSPLHVPHLLVEGC